MIIRMIIQIIDNRNNINNKDNTTTNNNSNNKNESNDNSNPRTNNQGKRKIIWFNLSFSKNVAKKIGRYFLKLTDIFLRYFFNRNIIKVSYSCIPYVKSAISSHYRIVLHPSVKSQSRTCNCINKKGCPLQEKCLSRNTLYEVDIMLENFQQEIYYGISETKFRTRYLNLKKSFNHEKCKNDTQLSNELWQIKASKEKPVL